MRNADVHDEAGRLFRQFFGRSPTVAAYAPGRVEVLGNHTDYNEGFVLSAAVNMGTFFLAAPADTEECRVVAGDVRREIRFDLRSPRPERADIWGNYVKGVSAGLRPHADLPTGFWGLFLGNLPLGAGLSSSAALEISAGLALSALYRIRLNPLALAKIGQKAEHEFAGVRCGLLDQISSLFGQENRLVMTDFRSLTVETVPIASDARFLMCNTHVKHALVESDYNERRRRCEEAAASFAAALPHPVSALRDVTLDEWKTHAPRMDPVTARRAAHIVGENDRVLRGRDLLQAGRIREFGRLMFESHESSRKQFENSCPELDALVEAAAGIAGVLGARLSGGGFGGSAVVLVDAAHAEAVSRQLADAYRERVGQTCDVRALTPSAGASVVTP